MTEEQYATHWLAEIKAKPPKASDPAQDQIRHLMQDGRERTLRDVCQQAHLGANHARRVMWHLLTSREIEADVLDGVTVYRRVNA